MNTERSLREKAASFLFYAGVIVEAVLVIIDKSAYTNPIEGQIFRLTFLLFLLKAALTKYSFREYAVTALFLALGAVSYFITGRNEAVRIVVFVAACKDVDMIRCLKTVFWVTLCGCLVIILLSLPGIYGSLSLSQDFGRGSVETRYVLGMGHPNALQCMVLVLTMLGLYLYHSGWKWYYYMLTLCVNVFFFLLTDSKTGLLVSVCTISLFFLASRIRGGKMSLLFSAGSIGIYIGSVAVSVMSAKDAMCLWRHFTQGEMSPKIRFYVLLNRALTGRIHSLIETKNHEGVTDTWSLFSRPENNYYFDMGWVRLFYWYGIVPALLAVIVIFLFMLYFAREGKLDELVFFSMFALYTVIEAHFVSVYIGRNYLLFIVGMYWVKLLRTGCFTPRAERGRGISG